MDIVIKEHPSTSRLALLEGFVDAHFDPETGAPACGGFFEVFTRLGRKDLNFGLQAQKLGRLSTEEETFVRDMYSDRCNDARNAKKHLTNAFTSIANTCRENPFYKQLSTTERLVFEALSPDGKSVVNPAAATTLAQAIHERWFEVPNLLLSPIKLLRLSANQGDAHAAYLLATRQTPDKVWLEKSATARKKYLDHANWVGHQSAYETLRQVKDDEWRSDFQSDKQNDWFLDDEMKKWREANERGPTLEGEGLLDMGIQLDDASFTLMIHDHPDFNNLSAYQDQHEIALGWIRKAAATSPRANHWLATSLLVNRLKVTERIGLLSAAAWPKSKVNPFRPALVDLAEIYAEGGNSYSNVAKAQDCLKQAIETIPEPEPSIAIRLADLVEKLYSGSLSQAYKNYASATKHSAYAAFRAGVLALRSSMVCNGVYICQTHFEACVEFELDDSDKRSLKAKTYAKAALLVGWGGGRNSNGDLSNDAWNDTAVLLVQQLAMSDYQTTQEFGWLTEEDIKRLVEINPHRRRLIYVDSEWNADEDIRTSLKKFKQNNEYAYGSSHPVLFLQGIIAASTTRVLREILSKSIKSQKKVRWDLLFWGNFI